MGIPVLLNPFGAERPARQKLLSAVQEAGDYIMSQQVNDSLNTCNQGTVLLPMPGIEECPMLYVCQNCVASVRDNTSHLTENGISRIAKWTRGGSWCGNHHAAEYYPKLPKKANNGVCGRGQLPASKRGWDTRHVCHCVMECLASSVCCTHMQLPTLVLGSSKQ